MAMPLLLLSGCGQRLTETPSEVFCEPPFSGLVSDHVSALADLEAGADTETDRVLVTGDRLVRGHSAACDASE